ncbi:hypothetical protein C8Q80DRAFT_1217828 [Daedaleopsis nitida]|nr:hypothetical protein C8Q80DRAFT_1217828 [Daedaleopsis nitida]
MAGGRQVGTGSHSGCRRRPVVYILSSGPFWAPVKSSLLTSRPPCAVLHKDFQSLLTLIYTSTTKMTLVLRPSAPAPSAALAPIKDLASSITSFATCASLFDLHGSTLASEVRALARDVCEAVRVLSIMFLDSAGEDYLVRTGTVHDIVEKARRDLPADNLAAVKKRWKADRGMLEDSLEEINAMIEEAGQNDQDGDGDDIDDEWDELGFGASKKMSEAELEHTKKIQPLVRFVVLFHKRVAPDVLACVSTSESTLDITNAALDLLPSHSNAVVVALEEVVAALYAPQKLDALGAAVSTLVHSIHTVHDSIMGSALLPKTDQADELAKGMAALDVDGAKGVEKKPRDSRKWFESCRAQIDKSAKTVEEMLATHSSNTT